LTSVSNTFSATYRADNLRASSSAGSVFRYFYYDGGNAVIEERGTGSLMAINVFAPDGLVKRRFIDAAGNNNQMSYEGDYLFDYQGNAVHILYSGGIGILSEDPPEEAPGDPPVIGGSPPVGGGGSPYVISMPLIHSSYNAWGQKNFVFPANFNMELHRFSYNARWGYRFDYGTGYHYCQTDTTTPRMGVGLLVILLGTRVV
jgi:hypothetical protein